MKNQCLFTGLKITLIILYVLAIIASIYLMTIYGLALSANSSDSANPDPAMKVGDKEKAKSIAQVLIIVFALSMVVIIIALIAVIIENKSIMTGMAIVAVLGCASQYRQGYLVFAIPSIFYAIITGGYTYMLYQKDKMKRPVLQSK